MKSISFLFYFVLLCGTCCINAQNNASVVYSYDTDGNRTALNYIIIRVDDENATAESTFCDTEEHADMDISLYPNPTNGYLVFSADNISSQTFHVKLYSIQGDVVEEREITSGRAEFNLSDRPAGVYFLSVVCNDEKSLWKIIKK